MTDLYTPSDAIIAALSNKSRLHNELMFEGLSGYSGQFQPIDVENYFRIIPIMAEVDWVSESGYFQLNPGDLYLDYHLLPREDLTIAEARALSDACYEEIATLLLENTDLKYLLGFTYKAIARFAGRQGLQTEQITDVNDDLIELARTGWRRLNPRFPDSRFEELHAVGLSRQDLIDKFGS